jgi:uncharacterized protein
MPATNMVRKVSGYVTSLMKKHLPETMYFHNLQHTSEVVEAATLIATNSGLNRTDIAIIKIAAWFHDSGYIYNYRGHEESSMAIAGTYLMQYGIGNSFLQAVLDCIEATKMPQCPKNHLQQVMCDADMYHLSQNYYTGHAQKLKKEWDVYLEHHYTQDEWNRINLNLLQSHRYFSPYGREVLENLKQDNIALLKNAIVVR